MHKLGAWKVQQRTTMPAEANCRWQAPPPPGQTHFTRTSLRGSASLKINYWKKAHADQWVIAELPTRPASSWRHKLYRQGFRIR